MKALIVDDHPTIIEMLSQKLTSQNFAVDTAIDGDTAFKKAKSRIYDIILLDIMLPVMSGFEIITSLRSIGVKTPILVISARGMVEDKIRGLDMGADDYLVKGFSLDELMSRVRTLTRRREGKRSNIYHCGDLVIDMTKLRVERQGKEINLSKKEFGILVELVKRKNCVVSKIELIELVWGEMDGNIFSNTIDVHIGRLRKKLSDTFSEFSRLHTVRGYGYLFKEDDKPIDNILEEPKIYSEVRGNFEQRSNAYCDIRRRAAEKLTKKFA